MSKTTNKDRKRKRKYHQLAKALKKFYANPGLSQFDDPDARPIEEFLSEDEIKEWQEWLKVASDSEYYTNHYLTP